MCCNVEIYYVGENPTYRYWAPVAGVMHGFKMVLFTASRGNNFVGGTYTPLIALLVVITPLPISNEALSILCPVVSLFGCYREYSIFLSVVMLLASFTILCTSWVIFMPMPVQTGRWRRSVLGCLFVCCQTREHDILIMNERLWCQGHDQLRGSGGQKVKVTGGRR